MGGNTAIPRVRRHAVWTLLLAFVSLAAHAAPPYKYYLLAPEQLSADLTVMSLEPGNTISTGAIQFPLGEYARRVIPSAELLPGRIISGTARYTLGSDGNATDLLAPDFFAGTAFVIPHITGDHKYYVQATGTTANLTITLGATTDTLQVDPGIAYEIDAGSDNGIAGRIDSDQPIVVVHVAYVSGAARDAYPVPPASTELVGIRSQSAVIGANTNGTSVTVYTSDATSTTYALNAGDTVAIAIGSSGAQGAGAAIHITSNNPIAAIQYGDGDGDDATAFWPVSALSRRHGIPVNAQYVAVACLQSGVSVTLFKGSSAPDTQTCSASGSDPGKLYFGSATSGSNVGAGWHLTSSEPVYAIYEASAVEDEHNLAGAQTSAGPATPTLAAISSPTTSNPLAISGTAAASTTVRLFVNGLHQQTATSTGGGAYSFNAELFDGNNVVHVVAVNGSGDESNPSNVEQVVYNNTVSRTQSGSLAGNNVWTPGSPATPYVISATLTIASGGKLVLQPGTTLKFANGASLTATGTLKIAGTAENPVTLTSNAVSPTRGIWPGVVVNATAAGTEINGALFEWAANSLNVTSVPVIVRNSTFRNFSLRGVFISLAGATGSIVQNNFIDNLNDTGTGIEVNRSGAATISGNTVTNCGSAIHVYGTSTATITGNVATSSNYGINVQGGGTMNPAPVVTGNQIYSNNLFNYYAAAYTSSGWTLTLNATGNWWGTTSPSAISALNSDVTDPSSTANTPFPTVNYSGFLDGPNGLPVPGNQLIGPFSATSTTLIAGATYDVLGLIIVQAGKSLTIPAGTTLRFSGNSYVIVDGTLTSQGTSGSPVTLTSGLPTPARGDWRGVLIRASGSLIDYTNIEWATTTINASGVATVRNSTIRNFVSHGVYITGAAASATVVQNNLIDNLNDSGNCVTIIANPSPTITGNTLTNCNYGVYMENTSSPVISGNIITGNNEGMRTYGAGSTNPNPIITGNQLYGNDTWNLNFVSHSSTAWTRVIDATGNWWGSTDPTVIAAKINDLTDDWDATTLPTADFRGFLDGPNGSPVPGNQLMGPLAATSTTLTGGSTYEVLGVTFVPAGKSLTIPAGTTLRFHNAAFIVVDGTLNVQGTSGNLVTMTSGKTTPARGDWRGIYLRAAGSLVEYAHIEWATTAVSAVGVAGTVRNSTLRNFSGHGVYITGAGATATVVQNNLIDNLNDAGNCITIIANPSPTITGNTLTNCNYGVYMENTSTPVISGNIITGNNEGMRTNGAGTTNPNPIITGNQLYDNDAWNLNLVSHSSTAWTKVIDATGNWWGSTDPTVIAAKISDLTDNWSATTIPTADFRGFLDGPGGSAVPGNYLVGPFLTTPVTLTAGTTYDVIGVVYVQSGKTLTIPAGVTLRFLNNSFIAVDGTLNVQGTSGNLVTMTSGKATPARGDWRGIYLRAAGSLIEYVQIEWTNIAVSVVGVTATVRNSTFRNFSTHGMYLGGAGATGTLVQNNVIDNLNDAGNCIFVETGANAAISGNTLTNCDNGVYVENSSTPVISGNIITGNNSGVETYGASSTNPNPIITGNQLYDNDTWNLNLENHSNTAWTRVIDATGNWWGSTNPTTIAAKIHDLTDSWTAVSLPTADFRGFLDGPGGSPVAGNQLNGPFSATSTTLTTGASYDVIGVTWVPAGKTLTIPSGTTLRFHPGSFLVVDGTLSVQGTASSRARFQSSSSTPANGNWHGIVVRATATGTVIDYALIEWMVIGVDVRTANVTVSNSIMRNFTTAGIAMNGSGASSQLLNNFIDNFTKVGDGISLTAASPAITGNRIYRTNRGMYMYGNSTPAVSGNILTGNNVGILLDGNNSNSATAVPRPTITGNDIYGNTNAQLEVFDFGTTNPAVITATGNWWGTATPVSGTHIKFTSGTPVTAVDFSSPASGPLNGVASGSITLSEMYFSPNGDSVKDTTTIAGTLSASSSWTVAIRSQGGATVRTFTGSGTAISGVWDGQDGSGTPQPEGAYDCEVTIPGSPDPMIVGFCSMTLDVTPPVNVVTSPAGSTTVQNVVSVPVNGSASDAFLVSYTLDFGAGVSPSTWTTIQTQATGITSGLLGNWIVSSSSGAAFLPNGPYTLRLRTSDRAGNAVTATVPVTVDIVAITGVTQNLEQIRPLLSEQLQIGFTLSAPATAYLRIHPEQGGALVKEVSQVFGTSGAKTLSWDGRNTAGAYVPDEAYSFSLFIDDGVRTAIYELPDIDDVGSGSGTIDSSYNATRNDFWKMNYALVAPKGRVRMQVRTCGPAGTHMAYDWVPFLPGTFLTMWDGRDQNGNLVSGTCDIYFDAPDPLSPASVIVKGVKPTITGTGASPNIEVKPNPYKATHSYDQVSKITYRVSQDSYVTVKLLPPGVSDPASPQAILLENGVLKNALSGGTPADHVVEWKGYDPSDTNDILVSNEGVYTFTIEATGATSGITSLYRGALQLYQ
jgi:parallel beta-helix repeat protein